MCFMNNLLCLLTIQTGDLNRKLYGQLISFSFLTDGNFSRDGGLTRLDLLATQHAAYRAVKAGGISAGKKRLRIKSAAGTAHFPGDAYVDIQDAIFGLEMSVTS